MKMARIPNFLIEAKRGGNWRSVLKRGRQARYKRITTPPLGPLIYVKKCKERVKASWQKRKVPLFLSTIFGQIYVDSLHFQSGDNKVIRRERSDITPPFSISAPNWLDFMSCCCKIRLLMVWISSVSFAPKSSIIRAIFNIIDLDLQYDLSTIT